MEASGADGTPSVRGLRALVTGAGVRVGRAIADALVDAGVHVAFHHHGSAAGAAAGVARAAAAGLRAAALPADLTDAEQCLTLAQRASEALGGLELLVNSAALFERVPFERIAVEQLDRMLGMNVRAPFLCTQGALPFLRASVPGRAMVLNVLDIAAERPWAGYAHYCSSKAALQMLTLQLAKELAPAVRVNGVAPGIVLFPEAESERAARLARVPLQREGTPADVAAAVLFLWRSPYVTGAILPVDGGGRL